MIITPAQMRKLARERSASARSHGGEGEEDLNPDLLVPTTPTSHADRINYTVFEA